MSKSSIFDEIYVADLVVDVANFDANIERMVAAVKDAFAIGKHIICTPELSLCGYPPEDLVLKNDFKAACQNAQSELISALAKIDGSFHFFFGNILPLDKNVSGRDGAGGVKRTNEWRVGNAYFEVKCQAGGAEIVRQYLKRDLPQYGVFDERRYFVSGLELDLDFQKDGSDKRIAIAICEDIWNGVPLNVPASDDVAPNESPPKEFRRTELPDETAAEVLPELLLVPNASPYTNTKYARRLKALGRVFKKHHLPTLYFNARGAQDELVFDQCVIKYTESFQPKQQNRDENDWKAILQGLECYVQKNGLASVVLGLSGGVDSAVVATLAADALRGENVVGISMPSRYSSLGSKDDAAALAKNLGCAYSVQPIELMFDAYLQSLPNGVSSAQPDAPSVLPNTLPNRTPNRTQTDGLELSDVAVENLQARIRGNIIMAYSNSAKSPCLALATGNKSELAVGYSTIYGDAVGGYAPIKDLLKTRVFELAKWRNALNAEECARLGLKAGVKPIPEASITKPPSAELRPGQLDQHTLPEYDILDNIIDHLMRGDESFDAPENADAVYFVQDSPASGLKIQSTHTTNVRFEKGVVEKVRRMLKNAQWKRFQYPPGPKLTDCAFGKDWRMPLTSATLPSVASKMPSKTSGGKPGQNLVQKVDPALISASTLRWSTKIEERNV